MTRNSRLLKEESKEDFFSKLDLKPLTQDNKVGSFGLVGEFKDDEHSKNIYSYVMYDSADFGSDEEENQTFNDIFATPEKFDDQLFDDLVDRYGRDVKNSVTLINMTPVTSAENLN